MISGWHFDVPASLKHRAEDALARASVLSEGRTQSWNPSTHGGDRDYTPTGTGSTYHALMHRLAECRTVLEVSETVAWGEDRLLGHRFGPSARPVGVQAQVISEHQGAPASEVAGLFGVHRTTIRRWRQKAGQSPEYGQPPSLRNAA